MEGGTVVARGLERRIRSSCSTGTEFELMMKRFWGWMAVMVVQQCECA